MNKIVRVGSAGLLLLGLALGFLPPPWNWFMPGLVVAAWLTALWRPRVSPVVEAAPAPEPVAAPVPEPEIREVFPQGWEDEMNLFRASLEVLRGLKTLVVTDTEKAVVQLTEALFTLVASSKEVSKRIEKSLSFLTHQEEGLGKTLGNLEQQVKVFDTLNDRFGQLKLSLTSDIEALSGAVGSINQFSDTLSDLADQTNVLAINASIEAARVGVHGRGFAVIATQVQALARNSKAISDRMASTVREVVSHVETSFERQTQRIRESEKLILDSERELRTWAAQVSPQLAEAGTTIGESRKLAATVTEQLGQVTVSLQFQDRTHQVLDHMGQVLGEVSDRLIRTSGLENAAIPQAVREKAYEAASRTFTVHEEWALVPGTRTGPVKSVDLF